jgi:hypothetical protein
VLSVLKSADSATDGRAMIAHFVRTAVLAISVSCAVPAPATEPDKSFHLRVRELVHWISQHSDYPSALATAPRLVFLPPDTIRHGFGRSSMGYSKDTRAVRAAQSDGAIYLPDTFTLGRDDFMLLHELVHHLQDESGRKFECLAEREREAYRLQTRFVEETQTGEAPNDMFMLMLRCDIR